MTRNEVRSIGVIFKRTFCAARLASESPAIQPDTAAQASMRKPGQRQ
jgi:hypothetical protein